MKKILLFISLALTAFAGHTQQSGNTLIPISQNELQDGLFVIRVLKEKTVLLGEKIDSLNRRIALKDANEIDYQAKVQNLQSQVDLLQIEKGNSQAQIQLLQTAYNKTLKDYRKQKRKTVFVGIAGALATVASIVFIK